MLIQRGKMPGFYYNCEPRCFVAGLHTFSYSCSRGNSEPAFVTAHFCSSELILMQCSAIITAAFTRWMKMTASRLHPAKHLKLRCSNTPRAHTLHYCSCRLLYCFPRVICKVRHLLWQQRVLTRTSDADPSPRENLMKVSQLACFLWCFCAVLLKIAVFQ